MSVSGIKAKVRKERVNKIPCALDAFLLTNSYFFYIFTGAVGILFCFPTLDKYVVLLHWNFLIQFLLEVMLASNILGESNFGWL